MRHRNSPFLIAAAEIGGPAAPSGQPPIDPLDINPGPEADVPVTVELFIIASRFSAATAIGFVDGPTEGLPRGP
jgi:hypothetical protein